MSKFNATVCWIILILVVSACQPSEQLPTLQSFPTATASDVPTATDAATSTATQTVTPSPTASNTATATMTRTPTRTRVPSSTPTSTQTSTPTNTPLPTATFTALPTRTPTVPVIENFQTNKTTASNGEPIIVRWAVDAESVRLEVIDSTGVVIQTLDVNLVGTFNTNTPATGTFVSYRLIATRASEELRQTITVNMEPTCATAWFFSNPPDQIGCPLTSANFVPITFQQFQNGFMFQATVNGAQKVCAIQNNSNLYSCYAASAFAGAPPVTPPAGLQTPDAAFASVFYTQLATGGFWYDVIGFATGAAVSTNTQTQNSDAGFIAYLFPNGTYAFDSGLSAVGAAVIEITP